MTKAGALFTLEYGQALPNEARSGQGYSVFGSNGEVGKHSKALIPESGIIVGRKGSVGKVNWSSAPFWPIDTSYWVKCAAEDKRWLYWLLSWLPLARLNTSTGVPGLNRDDVYALDVVIPALNERQYVALVLDTLDSAIHETEAIIAKLTAVKHGLLNDLLTRGINSNGELRPPQTEAPHLYTELTSGIIPSGWTTTTLGTEADFQSGYAFKEHELSPSGMKVVRISNLHKPDFPYWKFDGNVRESWVVNDGDLLFSWAGVANSIDAYIYKGDTALLNQHIYNLRIPDGARKAWVYYCLSFLLPKLRETIEGGAGQLHLTKDKIQKIEFAVPGAEELVAIINKLDDFEVRVSRESSTLAKLQMLRSALLDDLLTGRVRVTPLIATATQGSA